MTKLRGGMDLPGERSPDLLVYQEGVSTFRGGARISGADNLGTTIISGERHPTYLKGSL